MKISTKGRYGLRALLDLAVHSQDESITLANIAERQEISVGYLEQIFSTLRKAGMVIGTKGPQGGYVLAQPADKLPVQTVLDVLEGDLFTISEDIVEAAEAAHMQDAIRQQVWNRITETAAAALSGITLRDLVEAYEQNKMKDNYIFYI
jgi:Rrf2 family transcriptional regulator, cysteine metabolism repressor